ncbi:MAG: serine hydrolase [Holosporales bacterium]|nr:serine hydrolase [Holosporales bacterium]
MLKTINKFFAIAVILPLLASSGQCRLADSEIKKHAEKVDKIIQEGIKKLGIPGCAFVVARKDKIIHVAVFGKTTQDSKSPTEITPYTAFPISSVTKNFTAFLVGALVADGKIQWNDKVRKYLPKFFMTSEELSDEMTVLDLISHSSGYKHFAADSLFAADYDKARILNAFRYLKQKPGEFRKYYGYQNIVFGIVGDVLEAATGEKYEDLLQKYIFDKMGMKDSSAIRTDYIDSKCGYFKYLLSRFGHDREKFGFFKTLWRLISKPLTYKPQHTVIGHSRFKNVIEQLPCIGIFHKFPATSGVNVSATDFAKWISMLAGSGSLNNVTIVPKSIFDKITSPIAKAKNIKDDDLQFVKSRYEKDNLAYCIGTFVGTYSNNGKNGRPIIFHMGGIYGASAFFAISHDDDLGVGVICNFGGTSHSLFAEYMVNQLLDLCFSFSGTDWLDAELNRKKYIRKRQAYFHSDLAEKNPTPMKKPEAYIGKYSCEMYGEVTISYDGKNLTLSNGVNTTKLDHVNGDIFSFPCKNIFPHYFDEDEYISFISNASGNIDSVYISGFSENHTTFKKIGN